MDRHEKIISRLREENDVLRERIRQLESAAVEGGVAPGALGLTPTEGRIVSAIMNADVMPSERLRTLFYDMDYETVKVHISRARRKIAVLNLTLGCVYGVGYFIPEEHKAVLRTLRPQATEVRKRA